MRNPCVRSSAQPRPEPLSRLVLPSLDAVQTHHTARSTSPASFRYHRGVRERPVETPIGLEAVLVALRVSYILHQVEDASTPMSLPLVW